MLTHARILTACTCLLSIVPAIAGAPTAGAVAGERALQEALTDPSGEREIRHGHWTLTIAQNTGARGRRRGRAKPRGGKYSATAVQNGGTIHGVIVYRGDVPKRRKIQIVKDHELCNNREKLVPRVAVNDAKQVANVVVFLGDIASGKAVETESNKPVINQRICTFEPHVQIVQTGQPFAVVNSDPIAHNLHCTQDRSTLFNPIQPRLGMRSEFTIDDPGLATIRCNIHNWMRAYLYVLWHPYHQVTKDDGAFTLTHVPPGEYELVAWQEHLGETTTKVLVTPGAVTEVEIALTKK